VNSPTKILQVMIQPKSNSNTAASCDSQNSIWCL